jgi:hypothetical protein
MIAAVPVFFVTPEPRDEIVALEAVVVTKDLPSRSLKDLRCDAPPHPRC